MDDKIIKGTVLNILSLEDSVRDYEIICEQLTDAGFDLNISRVEKESEFALSLRSHKYDIILADFKLPAFDAFEALRLCNEICPEVPFICISGTIGEEKAIELLKQGAVDYVLKDRLERLPFAIKRALDEAKDKNTRKLAEETLRESEFSLRYAQKIAKMGSWEWDMVKHKTWWSDNYFALHGLKPSEVEPSYEFFRSKIHQDDVHLLDEKHSNIEEDKTPVSFEIRVIQPDGNIKWVQNNIYPVIENDKIVKLKGVIIDITEHKLSEIVLQESNERLNVILDNNPIAIWDWNIKTDEWFATQKYYTMLGYPPERGLLDNTVWLNRVHPDDRETVRLKIANVLNHSDEHYEYDARMLHADGSYRWHTIIGHVIERDKNGKALRMLGVRVDITERKQAEISLKRKIDEMEKFHNLTIGRELTMIELKKEVNELLKKSGQDEKYRIIG